MKKPDKTTNFRDSDERMKYTGTDTWVNTRTGEMRQMDSFEKPVGRQAGSFMIAYLAQIVTLIDKIGNQKMQVVKYILNHMCKTNNTLVITNRELASRANVSINTVTETLKLLREANLVETRTGAIMLNPLLMNNKKPSGEATMMVHYKEFAPEETEDQLDGQLEIADTEMNVQEI